MKRQDPLRPIEFTWEDCLLGGGVRAQFRDPTLPLHVEIGPGEDAFLLESAASDPAANWLGIEYSRKRIGRYVRRVERTLGQPGNLRLLWRPALDVVGPLLSPRVVSSFHIYFPDPWPKAHHARYRLLAPGFLAALCDSLRAGGRILMATDSEAYAQEIVEAAQQVERLESEYASPGYALREAGPSSTAFEQRWRDEGRQIHALAFRRLLPKG